VQQNTSSSKQQPTTDTANTSVAFYNHIDASTVQNITKY